MLRFLKKTFNLLFSRLFLVGIMLAVQIFVLFYGAYTFSQVFRYVYQAFGLWSMITAITVVNNKENPSYKITWIITILFFPSIGWLCYLVFGNKRIPEKLRRRVEASLESTQRHMRSNDVSCGALHERGEHLVTLSQYVYNVAGYPVQENTRAEYYPVGELMFQRMLEELRKAKRYILLEYFIIRPGIMWDAVFEIIREKAAAGVEVRLMYDDVGSISTLPKRYERLIREAGIRLCVFNPFRPRVSVVLNYRDHRKITVIDGKVAFCGGINLADEYINEFERFGHWKDTGVLLEGDAAWPFAFMFLQQWQFATDEIIDYDHYRADPEANYFISDGFAQPFGDTPLDDDNVTEIAYMNIISRAKRYVYISTPYLVIDNEMETALCAAAQSGVDIRIITPHRYDKWYVHLLTRSHYARLIRAGVRIYEYTPGFMHGKMFVADDEVCMVGTCNMDFRSFYLHYECSVVFYHSSIGEQVKQDMLDCQQKSQLITPEEAGKAPFYIKLLQALLKLFAPLM